jgi:hypothetical protein
MGDCRGLISYSHQNAEGGKQSASAVACRGEGIWVLDKKE